MEAAGRKTVSAVEWDTCSNKVYFNVEQGSLDGRLIVRKTSDGKIGMVIERKDGYPSDPR
jgi:hypothetical protein